jgi:tetratricopeptide (TPR) repeat protein
VSGERRFVLSPLSLGPASAALELLRELLRGSTVEVDAPDVLVRLGMLAASTDGLPLALELLAPQIASAGVDLVLERVKRAPRTVLDLRSVLESLWTGLEAPEQRALARLSVFRGGFDLDAALAVLASDDGLSIVHALCERSALSPERRIRGQPRFKLLAPLRAFAADKLLEPGGDADLAHALREHARYFAARSDARPGDWDDLVLCVERCLSSTDAEDASLAVGAWAALEPILAASGSTTEQLDIAERVAAHCERLDVADVHRARALTLRGDARRRAGRLDDASADFEAALELATTLGHHDLLGRAEKGLGAVAYVRGELAEADAALSRALGHFERAADDELRGIVLSDLGASALAAGDPARAKETLERALDLLEPTSNVLHRAGASANLGVAFVETGDPVSARRGFAQAERLSAGTTTAVHGFALANLGLLAHFDSDLDSARENYARALAGHATVSSIAKARALRVELVTSLPPPAASSVLVEVHDRRDVLVE